MRTHIVLPDPAGLSATHIADYQTGMCLNTQAWNDQAADWFAATAHTTTGERFPATSPGGSLRVLSAHQATTLLGAPCPLAYSMLLTAVDAADIVPDKVLAAIVDSGSRRLLTELLATIPARCSTTQLETAIAGASLAELKVGTILDLPATADLSEDALVLLLERAAKRWWAEWLTGALPAQPTQAIVDKALDLPRFRPGNGLPNEDQQRRVMAQQVASELNELVGDGPVPPVAMSVLEGLGAELVTRAAAHTAAGSSNVYARTLSAWASRELGDDPQAWATLVRLAGVLTVTDLALGSLATVVKTALERPEHTTES